MSKRIPILFGFLLLFFIIWLQLSNNSHIVQVRKRLENMAYDIQLQTQLLKKHSIHDTQIAIVDIDDKSLKVEGRWPWSRAKLAVLTQRLQEDGAVVIAFDILFPENEINTVTIVQQKLSEQKLLTPDLSKNLNKLQVTLDFDQQFANSIKNIDTVLGISFLSYPVIPSVKPKPLFVLETPAEKQLDFIQSPGLLTDIDILQNAAKGSGFLNVFPDEDGIIRRVPILMRFGDDLYASLALEAVKLFLFAKINLITADYRDTKQLEAVQLGENFIPVDAKAQMIIPFKGKSFTFPYYSATDVLNNKISKGVLEGKIIFVGGSATGLGDLKTTAIQSIYPGVEVHATIADAILKNKFTYRPTWALGAEVILTVFLGILLIFLFPFFGPRVITLFIIFVPVILFLINNFLWQRSGIILSFLIPITFTIILALANIMYGYLFETRRREHLKTMFGQYVPAKHIDEMLKGKTNFGLYGEDREMTVLFADIRDFTTISEPLSATQLKDLLNEFFTPMTEIIFKHRGTIDKYVGDLLMAFWGAPLRDKMHAKHALQAALEMQDNVVHLQKVFQEKGWPELNIGIGINTGEMSVGDMGSKFRRNYTVLGDAVNLASRVENLSKFYNVKIIVTANTQKNQKTFLFRKLDRVIVKGKKQGIELFELIGKNARVSDAIKNEMQLSDLLLEDYFKQDWESAEKKLSELIARSPECKLYQIYKNRIDEFKKNPPPPNWDGIYIHANK